MKQIKQNTIAALAAITLITGCQKDDSSSLNSYNNNGEKLHTSFTTPEWNAVIDCNDLRFDYTKYTTYTPTSASTNLQWSLTLPQDSSLLYKTSNLKKYPIVAYGSSFSYPNFSYLQKVPFTQGSTSKLVPIANANITDSSYHQINAVIYDHSDTLGAYFKVKADYKMMMRKLPISTGADSVRFVYGDYLIMVLVNRK